MRIARFTNLLLVGGLVLVAGGCASRDGGFDRSQAASENANAAGNSKKLAKCPVMENEPIDTKVYIKTDDGRVYFCCKDCIAKYKANPAKYAENVAAQRRVLADRN
ncbi:MAG: hypothetical protein HY287_03645 [Planctomycetes bacterium]|nr:hypothetical protein [Planctomycetota bacterium]MBI3833405.1 hypothetical protein [Planctomycetota bacterium]